MRIRQKTNLLKRMLPGVGVIFFVALLLTPVLMTTFPAKTSAVIDGHGRFEYSDTKASNVIEVREGKAQQYSRSSSGQGVYNGGYDDCSAFIQTKSHRYDGDTNAEWRTVCNDSRDNIKETVTIAKQKNYVGTWVDHNHITVDGVTYYDSHTDDNLNFVATNQSNGCPANVIKGFHGNGGGDVANAGGGATITINEPYSSDNGKCTSKDVPISFDNTQNFLRFFKWVDGGTIQTTDGKVTFVKGDNGKFVDNGSTCKSTFEPDGDLQHGTLVISYDGDNPFGSGYPSKIDDVDFSNKGGCQVSKPITGLSLADVDNQKKAAGTGGAGGSANGDDAELGCEGTANPLSWIICPVINDLLVPAIDATDGLITQEMVLPANDIFCANDSGNQDTCDAYYTAWASFRNMALGLIAIAGLVIIIAQALGMEILDAYTIRKTLPRILIAAIAITLSWPLMNFAVTLSNNLGFGIRDLITAPFHNLDDTINLNFAGSGVGDFFGGLGLLGAGLVGGASIWIISGGLGIILSYVLTAGLAVLIAILVLVLRQIAIIMLILLSPIAIVAYVLPNTQRIFRLWWESFTRALLMFPLIAAFIAAGRVFAAISIASANNGVEGSLQGLIGFVAYFAPYFMIPLTFRLSGSMMSGMGNFIQQRAQPAFGGLANYRSGARKDRIARQRAGGLYNAPNRLAKAMNTIGDYTVGADENLAYDFGSGNRLGAIGRGKYNPIGYAGRKLLGGRASDLANQIGHSAAETTANAAKKANIHHSTARAVLGFLGDGPDEIGKGLTAKGHERLQELYPEIKDSSGNVIGRANIPKHGDTQGLVDLGHFLQQNSYEGSDAMYAGHELEEKAGLLSRTGLDMETKRATQQSVAAHVLATEGKLNPDQNNLVRQQMAAGHRSGSAEMAVADDLHTLREQASTQQRHSLRRGKGSQRGKDGGFYSVYGDKMIEDESGKMIPAYQSKKAADSLLTLREDAAAASKGEFWDDIRQAAAYHGGKAKWERARENVRLAESIPDSSPKKAELVRRASMEYDQADQIRHLVAKSIGMWGRADPGGKAKASAVAREMGLSEADILEASDPKGLGAEENRYAEEQARKAQEAEEANQS